MEALCNFTYSVEDTYDGCYRDIGQSLSKLGWKKRDRSKWKKKTPPALLWTIGEKDVNFSALLPGQVVNHFEGISEVTTKMGLCNLLRESPWISENPRVLSPRCYNIGDPVHREEFVDDFYLTAATTLLKVCVLQRLHGSSCMAVVQRAGQRRHVSVPASSPCTPTPEVVLMYAIRACSWHLKVKLGGEWPEVDRTFDTFDGTSSNCAWCGLSTKEVNLVLQESYRLVAQDFTWNSDVHLCFPESGAHGSASANGGGHALGGRETRVLLVLQGLRRSNPQFDVDGLRNVWIVKAPDACQGVGLRVLHRLDDILDCERGMGGRTVQKYIETPLLARPAVTLGGPGLELRALVKFDLRVWVLVTSVTPLKAHIFSAVYGRCCSQPYSLAIESFGDSLVHLTNYAIQKKDKSSGATSSSSSSSSSSSPSWGAAAKERERSLLMSHAQVMDVVASRAAELRRHRPRLFWEARVWPAIKRKIARALELAAACGSLVHRPRSFEFLGVDVLLDERLRPWILEVNMSPAMAHRNDAQSRNIRKMAQGLVKHAVTSVTGLPLVDDDGPVQIVLQPQSSDEEESATGPGDIKEKNAAGAGDDNDDCVSSDGEERDERATEDASGEWEELISQTGPQAEPAAPSSSGLHGGPRPSSANATSRPRSSVGSRRARDAATDVTFAVTGVQITGLQISGLDKLNGFYSKRTLLLTWMRRYLARTRAYHAHRRACVSIIQCFARCCAGRASLTFRRRRKAATHLQAHVRCLLGKLALRRLVETRAAVLLQATARRCNAVREMRRRRCYHAARVLKRWRARCLDVYIRKAAFKIVWCGKAWVKVRKNHARRVIACVALHYRWWRRKHTTIQRTARRWLVRRRQWRFMMLRTLRTRALEAREGARLMAQRRCKRLRREVAAALFERFQLPMAAQWSMLRKLPTRPLELGVVGPAAKTDTTLVFSFPDDDLRTSHDAGGGRAPTRSGDGEASIEGVEGLTKKKAGYLFDFVSRYNGTLGVLRSALAHSNADKDGANKTDNEGASGDGRGAGASGAEDATTSSVVTDTETLSPCMPGVGSEAPERLGLALADESAGDLATHAPAPVPSLTSPSGTTDFDASQGSWSVSSPQSFAHCAASGMRLDLGLENEHLRSSQSVAERQHQQQSRSRGHSGGSSASGVAGEGDIYRDTWGNLRRKSDNKRVGTTREGESLSKSGSGYGKSRHSSNGGGSSSSSSSQGRSRSRSKECVKRQGKGGAVPGSKKSAGGSGKCSSGSSSSSSCSSKARRSSSSSSPVEASSPWEHTSHSDRVRERIQAATALGGLTGYVEAAATEARLRSSRSSGGVCTPRAAAVPVEMHNAHPLAFREVQVPLDTTPVPPVDDGWVGVGAMGARLSGGPISASSTARAVSHQGQGLSAPPPPRTSSVSATRGRPSSSSAHEHKRRSRPGAPSPSFAPTSTVGYGPSWQDQVSFDDGAYDTMRENALRKLASPKLQRYPSCKEQQQLPRRQMAAVPHPPSKKSGGPLRPYDGPVLVELPPASLDSPWGLDSPSGQWVNAPQYQAQPFWF